MKCTARSRLAAYAGTGLHIILGLLQLILVSIVFLVVCYNNYYYGVENYRPLFVLPVIMLATAFLLRGFAVLIRAEAVPVCTLETPASFIAGTQVVLFISFLYLRSFFDKPTEHLLTIISSLLYSLDMVIVVPCLVATFLHVRRVNIIGGCENQPLFV